MGNETFYLDGLSYLQRVYFLSLSYTQNVNFIPFSSKTPSGGADWSPGERLHGKMELEIVLSFKNKKEGQKSKITFKQTMSLHA